MTLAAGRELSHYRLVEPIGEGGMGVVWRATDTTLGRDVAIKVLPDAFAGDPERMARFEREARLLASLNHPHIASIYGVGVTDGVRFLAMELIDGADLAERISHGPMPVAEAVETACQIAEALEFAHEKGIIHRDLKPANIKLTADGQVKVLDFGLAKALEGELPSQGGVSMSHSPTLTTPMTAAQVILGTAAYMSPEQARGRAVDRRTDIWAFGCVLYECLTARRAFAGETVSDTIAMILERDPDLAALPGSTPPRVRELLSRCLEKDPKHRLRDIGDARITLEEALAARSPSGRLLVGGAPESGAASARRASPLAIGALAAVCLAAGAGAWALLGPRPQARDAETLCTTITMPRGVTVHGWGRSRDGRTIVVRGHPVKTDGTPAGPDRIYTRRLDQYEFQELPGTEGATLFIPSDNNLLFAAPVAAGSPQLRVFRIPLDRSAPATGIVDYDVGWSWLTQMDRGDLLVVQASTNLVRISPGGAQSAPMKLDAGRPGVSRYELVGTLPGGRGVLVNVVAYDSRGWHYSVGVLNPRTGKVRIIEEDGGNPVYSPTGDLVFSRGSTLLAAPFDLARMTPRGTPVAVWSGLSTPFSFIPSFFQIGDDGGLFYRPGEVGGKRQLAFVGASGRVEPWGGEPRAIDGTPALSPDGRRFAVSIVNARGIDELWISDVARPGYHRLGSDPDADCANCVWSPDGNRIVYSRRGKDAHDGLYVQDAEGGEAKRVLALGDREDRAIPASWLPDGSALVVFMLLPSQGKTAIGVLRLAGEESDSTRLRILLSSNSLLTSVRLSPEGRRLAYVSDESGKPQVYVAEFRPDGSMGRPIQIGTPEGGEPDWSHDGKWLFLLDDRQRVVKVSVGAAPELSISTPEEVMDLDKLDVAFWSVVPDGRFFVGLRNDDERDITKCNLVLGWTRELKRKMRES